MALVAVLQRNGVKVYMMKGTSEEGTECGMDGARERGGRKRAEEGLSDEGRKGSRETAREVS